MRPAILFDLFAPVTALPGIGPRLGPLIEKAAGPRVVDLLWHLPTGLIDRRYSPKISALEAGPIASTHTWCHASAVNHTRSGAATTAAS
jgi:ATP-dependent DNA helicase RecG